MSNPEQAVRDAATALHDAIIAARAAGLYVQWPNRPEHLPGIAISETKKAVTVAPVAETIHTEPAAAAPSDDAPDDGADERSSFAVRGRRPKT